MSLVGELKRRKVFQVAAAYLVVGWLLTEVLTTILPTLGAPDWTARAVILVFALGFLPTVILSWIFELTPEGIKRDHGAADGDSVTDSNPFNYAVIGTVIALIIVIGVLGARPAGEPDIPIGVAASPASVAVLPFVNMSADNDNEYFSDGLTETLLHMLAQIPDLQVAARTSSFAFKGQNRNVQEIAAALKVAHILEGSVQKVGDQIRVTAQLIRASDGFHVWSSSYDRTVDDIFAIQDEIAAEVGQELSASLLGGEKGPRLASIGTENTDAYDLYLQALKERSTYSYGGLQAAENLLKGALATDPDFVDAKTELADVYLHQADTGLIELGDAVQQISALTEQVLATDPDNIRANAMATFKALADGKRLEDPEPVYEAIDQLKAVVAAHPKEYTIRELLIRLMGGVKQYEQALDVQLAALELDPYSARVHYGLGSLYIKLKRWDEARASLTRSLELEAQQPNAYVLLGEISMQTNDELDYLQQMLKAMAVDPRDHELPGWIAVFLYNLELFEAADEFRDRVIAIAPTSEIAYTLDMLRAIRMGDEDASVAAARRAIEDDIEDRQKSYTGAVQHLLRVAAKRGTVAEESAWLESQAPGILDVDATGVPGKYRSAQQAALDAWYTTLPREELLARIDRMIDIGNRFGIDPMENPQSRLLILAMRGEVEAATSAALEVIESRPAGEYLGWKRRFEQAQFADIVSDSEVQATLARWEGEWSDLRGKVSGYLADLSATS